MTPISCGVPFASFDIPPLACRSPLLARTGLALRDRRIFPMGFLPKTLVFHFSFFASSRGECANQKAGYDFPSIKKIRGGRQFIII